MLSPAEDGDWKIDADASGKDFIRFRFTPAAGKTGTFRFPEIRIDGNADALKAVGSQGFTTLETREGSAMYLAVAEPAEDSFHAATAAQSCIPCDDGVDNAPHFYTDEEAIDRMYILMEEFALRYKDREIVGEPI